MLNVYKGNQLKAMCLIPVYEYYIIAALLRPLIIRQPVRGRAVLRNVCLT